MRISAIVVNYNGGRYIKNCVIALIRHLDLEKEYDEIIVVDNRSTDDSIDQIKDHEKVKCIILPVNLGYAGGCNMGAKHANGEILFFMNPDITLLTPVECIRDDFKNHRNCAIVAPQIFEQGLLCESLHAFPSIVRDCFEELGFVGKKRYKKQELSGMDHKPQPIRYNFYAQGSAFFVRKSMFEEVGGFDDTYFLYMEEVDLMKRLQEQGHVLLYEPRCQVEHVSGGSSGNLGWEKTAIRFNSKLRYFSKHTSKMHLLFHRFLMVLVLIIKIILYLPSIIGEVERQKLKAYIYGMQLYLRRHRKWI